MWAGFGAASAHRPVLEGLRHGGLAAALRKSLTAFGSGWRGLISVPASAMPEGDYQGLTSRDEANWQYAIGHFEKAAENLSDERGLRLLEDIEHGKHYAKQTGFFPVFISEKVSKKMLRETIRHERIHAAHIKNPQHPFFEQQVAKTPELEQALAGPMTRFFETEEQAHKEEGFKQARKLYGEVITPEKFEQAYAENRPRIVEKFIHDTATDYEMQARLSKDPFIIKTERLAFSNSTNKNFFAKAKKAGVLEHFWGGAKRIGARMMTRAL